MLKSKKRYLKRQAAKNQQQNATSNDWFFIFSHLILKYNHNYLIKFKFYVFIKRDFKKFNFIYYDCTDNIKQIYSKYCVGGIKNINETFDKIFHKKKIELKDETLSLNK